MSAGLAKARAVAITFANTPVALKILHHVHQQRPDLPVIVRTVDDSEIDRLHRSRRDRGRAGGARRQPDARVAGAARAGRPAQSGAEAHPHDPRGALRPLPRILPRRDRRRGRRRQPAGAACERSCSRTARRRSGARWPSCRPRRRRRSDGRAPPRVAVAASRARITGSRAVTLSSCSAGRRRWSWRSRSSCVDDRRRREAGVALATFRLVRRIHPLTDRGSLRLPEPSGYNQPPFPCSGFPWLDEIPPRSPAAPDCRCSKRDRDDRRDASATIAGGRCCAAST